MAFNGEALLQGSINTKRMNYLALECAGQEH